jgi:nucleotide-binding universal stress UspA family protein
MGVIVVATDGSTAATAALEAAIELARGSGDRVAVITVWRALQGDFGLAYPSTALLDDLLTAERVHAEETLAAAVERCTAAGIDVATRLCTGDPADCICAYARELDARLVAMGTHGYGAVMSLLVGSVSSDVIRHAGRPVLIVPESDEAPAATGSRLHALRRAS